MLVKHMYRVEYMKHLNFLQLSLPFILFYERHRSLTPDNRPLTPSNNPIKRWLQKTFCADYFRRFAFTLTLCLTVYLVYLLVTRGPVDLAVLAIFIPTSGVTQVFFGQEKADKKVKK